MTHRRIQYTIIHVYERTLNFVGRVRRGSARVLREFEKEREQVDRDRGEKIDDKPGADVVAGN